MFFFNLDLKGVNIGVAQFHTQFAHVFRHFEVEIEEEKLKGKKNCFENVVSDLRGKKAEFVNKMT